MTIRENVPEGINGRGARQQFLLKPGDAFHLDWLKARGITHVEETEDGYWVVLTRSGWLLAIIYE